MIGLHKLVISNDLNKCLILLVNGDLGWSIRVIPHPEFSEWLLAGIFLRSFLGVDLSAEGPRAELAPSVVLRFAVKFKH